MTVLFSFDFEFTHPCPRLGAPMELGIAACQVQWWRKDSDPRLPRPAFNGFEGQGETRTWRSGFAVPRDGVAVTPWVQANQGALLERMRCYKEPEAHNAERIESLKSFIRQLKKDWGDPIIPVGWCMGSDTAYLLDLLGEDCELVSYSNRDLSGILTGLTGQYDPPDSGLNDFLGVPPNENVHDALSDAKHQLALVKAALIRSWQHASLVGQSTASIEVLEDLGLMKPMRVKG